MTQANDLGAVANQSRTLFRGRMNVGFQALATGNSGNSAPNPTYPFMMWFDTSAHQLKIRNETDSGWVAIATANGGTFQWLNSAQEATSGLVESGTLSGASVTVTGIPSGVVSFDLWTVGVQTSSYASTELTLGTSAGIVTSGYASAAEEMSGSSSNNVNGIYLHLQTGTASYNTIGGWHGALGSGNRWTIHGMSAAINVDTSNTVTCGTVALPGVLDRFRIGTTSTFSAGIVSMRWHK